MVAITLLALSSCERVAPNFYGVLMENYGKNGKSDYSRQQGRVSTLLLVPNYSKYQHLSNRLNLQKKIMKEAK